MKQLASTEKSWVTSDPDKNGIADYWTLDVAGFYAMPDEANRPLKYIDFNFAAADGAPQTFWAGRPATPSDHSGYQFFAVKFDENGAPYAVNTVASVRGVLGNGSGTVQACHPSRFAFCAVPVVYGATFQHPGHRSSSTTVPLLSPFF